MYGGLDVSSKTPYLPVCYPSDRVNCFISCNHRVPKKWGWRSKLYGGVWITITGVSVLS